MTQEDFEVVFYRMRDKLFRFAMGFVRDSELAEDVVQDVMLKLWQHRDTVDTFENLDAWLMVLARNRALDMLRRRKETPLPVPESESLRDPAPRADRRLESVELLEQIQRCIDRLPEKARAVFHLREIEQMSYDEIARTTGYSLENVKVILFRARKQIQRGLTELHASIPQP